MVQSWADFIYIQAKTNKPCNCRKVKSINGKDSILIFKKKKHHNGTVRKNILGQNKTVVVYPPGQIWR